MVTWNGVGAPAGVVVGEAGGDVRSATDVEVRHRRGGTLENVNELLVSRHARREATASRRDASQTQGMCAMALRRSQFLRLGHGRLWRSRARGLTEPKLR